MCMLGFQQNVFNCLQSLIGHIASVMGYNGGVFDISWDRIDQGAYLTYCWIGPCQAPDVNFGELIVSCIA